MDYEKKYKSLVEAVKTLKEANPSDEGIQNWVNDNVPELAESEDEKIRKWIIAYLENRVMNTSITDEKDNCLGAIRWLKKQGEQKPAEVRTTGYWNVQDIKQKPTAWSEEDELYIRELESLVKQVWATAEHENDKDTIHKMRDLSFFLKTLKPQLKQEWSDDDEVKINRIVACLENLNVADNDILLKDVNWLKSIKDIFVPQPKQEWSEEDVRNMQNIDSVLFYDKNLPEDTCMRLRNWLKSLKPQNKWKPSDEQMEALLYEVNAWDEDSANGQNLKSLYQDLKKLKE